MNAMPTAAELERAQDYRVRDLSEAEWGRKEIGIAEHEIS